MDVCLDGSIRVVSTKHPNPCFNPCFGGCMSGCKRKLNLLILSLTDVSILVLVDLCLDDNPAIQQRLFQEVSILVLVDVCLDDSIMSAISDYFGFQSLFWWMYVWMSIWSKTRCQNIMFQSLFWWMYVWMGDVTLLQTRSHEVSILVLVDVCLDESEDFRHYMLGWVSILVLVDVCLDVFKKWLISTK